jgi:Cathepsin propeptide inhibitor domain (I29)
MQITITLPLTTWLILVLTFATYGRLVLSSGDSDGSQSRLLLAQEGKLSYMSLSSAEHNSLFDGFTERFQRIYRDGEERSSRFDVFLSNLALFDERNEAERQAGGSAVHGITRFADLTPEEFRAFYLTASISVNSTETSTGNASYSSPSSSSSSSPSLRQSRPMLPQDTPTAVNWAGTLTTAVKDQGEKERFHYPHI